MAYRTHLPSITADSDRDAWASRWSEGPPLCLQIQRVVAPTEDGGAARVERMALDQGQLELLVSGEAQAVLSRVGRPDGAASYGGAPTAAPRARAAGLARPAPSLAVGSAEPQVTVFIQNHLAVTPYLDAVDLQLDCPVQLFRDLVGRTNAVDPADVLIGHGNTTLPSTEVSLGSVGVRDGSIAVSTTRRVRRSREGEREPENAPDPGRGAGAGP